MTSYLLIYTRIQFWVAFVILFLNVKFLYSQNNKSICLDFTYNYSSQVVLSPIFSFSSPNLGVFGGPSFQLSSEQDRYDQIGYKVGFDYLILNKNEKIKALIYLNYEHLKYNYNVTLYDVAIPNVQIASTLKHTTRYDAIISYLGIKYYVIKRLHISPKIGFGYIWEYQNNPSDFNGFGRTNSFEKTETEIKLTYLITIGFDL